MSANRPRKILFSMTLLELMVSLALAAGLLSSIFYWIWSQNRLFDDLGSLRSMILQEERMILELEQTLGKICMKPIVDESESFSGFYLEEGELHFYFKSDVHSKPELNLIQKASLKLVNQQLILETRPCEELWPIERVEEESRKIVLDTHLLGLDFYFLYIEPFNPPSTMGKPKESGAQEKPEMGLLERASRVRGDLPLATVLVLRKLNHENRHVAIWREDGALVHRLERAER